MPRIELKEGLKLAGGFVLARLVGRGPGTEVWTSRRPEGHEGDVVVKILRDRGRYADLCAEAAAMQKLIGTERTAKLVEAHLFDDPSFIALEPVLDTSVAARLERGALPPALALQVFRDALLALAEAQDRGVPHGDLHAGNVLLDASGRAFLTDFGAMPALVPAPEDVARRADLAALGRLLLRMALGDGPPGPCPRDSGLEASGSALDQPGLHVGALAAACDGSRGPRVLVAEVDAVLARYPGRM